MTDAHLKREKKPDIPYDLKTEEWTWYVYNMKKRLDKNYVVKNIGKQLYCLYNETRVKISEKVINQ